MKNNSGFTLAEVIIVIVIVGILSIIAVPIYREHIKKSVSVEGQALLSEVMAAQEIFAARNKVWFNATSFTHVTASYVPQIGVDARRNKYFNSFSWQGDNAILAATTELSATQIAFSITTTGIPDTRADGISLTLQYYKGRAYEIIQN